MGPGEHSLTHKYLKHFLELALWCRELLYLNSNTEE